MKLLTRPWRQLFNFSGRATRTEYALLHVTAMIALVVFEMLLFVGGVIVAIVSGSPSGVAASVIIKVMGAALLIVLAVGFIGHVAISIRRLHDCGDSGLKYLFTLIPLIGLIFWLLMVLRKGDDYENAYGSNPRAPDSTRVNALGAIFS